MYLDHFKFKEIPFGITPQLEFFCELKGHQEALNVILLSIRSGEGFIKIIGEVGSGKTLLCRKVLETLDSDYITAYIPNPDLQPYEFRRALARELGIHLNEISDQHELLTCINDHLLTLSKKGKHVVLLIDEAQAIPENSLEALRLLTNLETEKNKLLQVVLFGQPELDQIINKQELRQLKQRITFSYYLPLLSREDLDAYLIHRLAKAGHTLGNLFNKKAKDILYHSSQGIPRLVNIICHKCLLIAYGRGEETITPQIMKRAIRDTDVYALTSHKLHILTTVIGLSLLAAFLLILYL